MNNKFRNKKGSTAIMMTVIILSSMLFIALTIAEIVKNGLVSGRTQIHSTVAFFAAEAGIERILWEARMNSLLVDPPTPGADNCGVDLNPGGGNGFNFCFQSLQDVFGHNTPTGSFDWDCVDIISGGSCPTTPSQLLPNNSTYKLLYEYNSGNPRETKIISTGNYLGINRIVEVEY